MTGLPTDAAALKTRLATHDRFSTRDINEWLLGLLEPRPGQRVLDVGCGTGRQAVAIAEKVGPSGGVVGLDASAAALAEAREAGARRGLDNLRLAEGRMEDLDEALGEGEAFDTALCCFALYYSASPGATLRGMRSRVLPEGRCFVCGPAPENNRAFVELCERVVPRRDQVRRVEVSLTFMHDQGPRLFRELFDRVDLHSFENPVTFPSPEDVLAYWRSYHLYSPDHEAAFRRAVEEHFAVSGSFRTVKVVRGALLS